MTTTRTVPCSVCNGTKRDQTGGLCFMCLEKPASALPSPADGEVLVPMTQETLMALALFALGESEVASCLCSCEVCASHSTLCPATVTGLVMSIAEAMPDALRESAVVREQLECTRQLNTDLRRMLDRWEQTKVVADHVTSGEAVVVDELAKQYQKAQIYGSKAAKWQREARLRGSTVGHFDAEPCTDEKALAFARDVLQCAREADAQSSSRGGVARPADAASDATALERAESAEKRLAEAEALLEAALRADSWPDCLAAIHGTMEKLKP